MLRHYRIIDLTAGNAETIVDILLASFDCIDNGKKLIAPMTDGCAKKRVAEKVPQLKYLGSWITFPLLCSMPQKLLTKMRRKF